MTSSAELHVGCAMWTHRAWPFSGLRSYAGWCNAVEGNTTFYATPARDKVASWAEETDPSFRFVVKLPRTITHEQRLSDPSSLKPFLAAIEPLGSRVHALWIQLPGSFAPSDTSVLARFLGASPPDHHYAVEVRHTGFFEQPRTLETALAVAGAEWVPFDTTAFFTSPPTSAAERDAWTKKPRMPLRTAALTDRPVIRYLGRDSVAETVAGWQPWLDVVAGWLREGRSPTVFIHTPDNADAPPLARRFHDEVRTRVPSLVPLPTPALAPDEQPTLW